MKSTLKQALQENRYELLNSIQEAKQKGHIINVLACKHYYQFGNIFGFLEIPSFADLEEISYRYLHYKYSSKQVEESEREIFNLVTNYHNKKIYISYLKKKRKEICKEIEIENKKRLGS
jgi:hypothetical protein